MKIIVHTLMLCATIAATHNVYADVEMDLGERMNMPSIPSHTPAAQEPATSQYPMIEKHAPDKIKEACKKKQSCTFYVIQEQPCPACDIIERILWCAEKNEKKHNLTVDSAGFLKPTPTAQALQQYCRSCFEGMARDGKLAASIIDRIALETGLSHDAAFALLKEFNKVVDSLERASVLRHRED